eukprot:8782235-Ditylum_brightwellii.AAC.1
MVLDADGGTLQEEGGGRILMQVPPESKKLFTNKNAIAALMLLGAYGILLGIIAIIGGMFSPNKASNHAVSNRIKHTDSAFDYNDGAAYGYNEPNPKNGRQYSVQLDEPMISGGITIPPYIDA